MLRDPSVTSQAYREALETTFQSGLSLRDVTGRFLGENNASPVVKGQPRSREGIDYQPCRYPGSRNGKPINVPALVQLHELWEPLLRTVTFLRGEYRARFPGGRLAVVDAWRLAKFGISLPNYLVARASDPVAADALPTDVAITFKTLFGLFMVTGEMFRNDFATDRVLEPDDYVLRADDRGLFQGQEGVCAAPAKKIAELIEVAVGGSSLRPSRPERLGEGEVDPFFRYAAAFAQLDLAREVFATRAASIAAAVLEELREKPGPTRELARRIASDIEERFRQTAAGAVALRGEDDEDGALASWVERVRREFGALSGCSRGPAAFDGFPAEDPGSGEVARLMRLFRASGSPVASLPVVGEGLVAYGLLARKAAALLEALQRAVGDALGHRPPAAALRETELRGKTPFSVLLRGLDVSIEIASDHLSFGVGAERLRLELPPGAAESS